MSDRRNRKTMRRTAVRLANEFKVSVPFALAAVKNEVALEAERVARLPRAATTTEPDEALSERFVAAVNALTRARTKTKS